MSRWHFALALIPPVPTPTLHQHCADISPGLLALLYALFLFGTVKIPSLGRLRRPPAV
jgi:hypothetical protein